MGPRPTPVEPSSNPVPGAPDPLDPVSPQPGPSPAPPDAQPAPQNPLQPKPAPNPEPVTMREIPTPDIRAAATPAQAPPDAGGSDGAPDDAVELPPTVPDAVPTDASKTLQP